MCVMVSAGQKDRVTKGEHRASSCHCWRGTEERKGKEHGRKKGACCEQS